MTNVQWIVVANGARAVLYSRAEGDEATLNAEIELEHPDTRRKGTDLATDRPGAVRGHGSDSTRYVPHMTPKQIELDHFGQQIADELDRAHRAGRFARLTLVASNPFLGILRSHLSAGVRDAVDHVIAHDYTTLPPRELRLRLAEVLA
jgi:protein required for attachment to host cells